MRSVKKIIFLQVFVLVDLLSATGQNDRKWDSINKEELAKVFEQIKNWHQNTPSYSFTVTHISYADYFTKVAADQSKGYFKKDKDNYHSFLLNIHTLQNSKYKLVLDTTEQLMMLSNPDQYMQQSFTIAEYSSILSLYTSIKVNKEEKATIYRLELGKNYPVSVYELKVLPNGLLKEIIFFYNQEVVHNPDDENSLKSKPRIQITFSDHKENIAFNYKEEFDQSRYIIKKDDKFAPTEHYKDYTFQDLRVDIQ